MIARAKDLLRSILPTNAFARGVGILVGGTAGAQLLSMLAAPLLTRLYSPEDFGLLAVYVSLLVVISVISSLRYELAIALPDDDGEAANVAALSLLLVGVSTLLTGLLVLLLSQPIAKLFGVPSLSGYLWMLPLGVLLTGTYKVFNYWAVRTKHFSAIAGTGVRQALTTIAIQLGAFKLGSIALLFGQMAGQSAGIVSLGRPALASAGFRQVSWKGIATAAERYRQFPIYSTWEGLLNTSSSQLPPVVLAAIFSPAAAGLYALAFRMLTLPSSVVGNAIGQVFFINAVEAYRAKQHGVLVANVQKNLINIGMPPVFLLVLMGPDLFSFIFGMEWRLAGVYAQWMAPWLFFAFVYSPLSTFFAVIERQKQVLVMQAILLIARVGAILLGVWIGDLELTIILFSMASAGCYFFFVLWIVRLVKNPICTVWRPFISAFGFSALAVSPLIVAINSSNISPIAWASAFLITTVLITLRYWKIMRSAY